MKKLLISMFMAAIITENIYCQNIKTDFIKAKLLTNSSQVHPAKKIIPAFGLATLFSFIGYKYIIRLINIPLYLPIISKIIDPCDMCKSDVAEYAEEIIKFVDFNGIKIQLLPISFLISYYIVNKLVNNREMHSNLIKFIAEWEINKSYTPKLLHNDFNKLYEQYLKKAPLDKKLLNKVINQLQKIIKGR